MKKNNDEKELLRLGFAKNADGMYMLNAKHQTFIAKVIDCNGPVYVSLSYQSKEIDKRPKSDRKGLPYINLIKDCISDGSLERAIMKYDVEDRYIKRNGFFYTIINPESLGKEVQP
uniref:hypothetical protein n=1 Tax=uncultured Dysgonomonas sp. TaxID=206096 RepID=UPI00261156DA|nr:hypothetical protein [uncultured Dysgonomonas sp.]